MANEIIMDSILCKLSDTKVLAHSFKEWLQSRAREQELVLDAISAALQCDYIEELDVIVEQMVGKTITVFVDNQLKTFPVDRLIQEVFTINSRAMAGPEIIEQLKFLDTNFGIPELMAYLDSQTVSLTSQVAAIEVMIDDSITSTTDRLMLYRDKVRAYGADFNNTVTETFAELISSGADLYSILNVISESFYSLCADKTNLEEIIESYVGNQNDFTDDNPLFTFAGINIPIFDWLDNYDYLVATSSRWQKFVTKVGSWWRNRTIFNKNLPDLSTGEGKEPYIENAIEYKTNVTMTFSALPESGYSGFYRLLSGENLNRWYKTSNVFGTLFVKPINIIKSGESDEIWHVTFDYMFMPTVSWNTCDIDLDGEYLLNGPNSYSTMQSQLEKLRSNNDFSGVDDILVEPSIISNLIRNRYRFIYTMLVEYYRVVPSREKVRSPVWDDNPYQSNMTGETAIKISNEGIYCVATGSLPADDSQMEESEKVVVTNTVNSFTENHQFSLDYVAMALLNLIGLTKVSGTDETISPYFFPYSTDLEIPKGAIHLNTDAELEKKVSAVTLALTSIIVVTPLAIIFGPKLLRWRKKVNATRAMEYSMYQSRMWNGEVLGPQDWTYYKWLAKKTSALTAAAASAPAFSKRNGDSDLLNRLNNDVTTIKYVTDDHTKALDDINSRVDQVSKLIYNPTDL